MKNVTRATLLKAIADWENNIGVTYVKADADTISQYTATTAGISVKILAVLTPATVDEVRACILTASKHGIPLYPISTGKNWGYTDGSPLVDNCVILKLSRMNTIIDFDPELGTVTLEPGVTQQQLYDFLEAQGGHFLTPVTGAGPDCSIVGNALERGYGITPIADHFQAVHALRAILADGSTYYSGLDAVGGTSIDKLFKWTVGPYFDGIFTQSNLGVVTEITISLARKPEHAVAYFFWVPQKKFGKAVFAIRTIIERVGALGSSINLMNNHRVLSMNIPYPWKDVGETGYITPELAHKLARRQMFPDWMGIGCMYGTRRIVGAAKRDISSILRSNAGFVLFLSARQLNFLASLASLMPFIPRIGALVGKLQGTFDVFLGKPSRIAIPLAHWKTGDAPNAQNIEAYRDSAGLLWYSPLIPMRPKEVLAYTEMVKTVCIKYRIDPLITLTSLSEKCFDSTVPILFRRNNPEEQERAHACYKELLTEGIKHGWYPYRLGMTSMRELIDPSEHYNAFALKIKNALDPKGIIAPGRYVTPTK